MEQVQARVMNHEMRNAARKLTPAERKDKQRRKLEEDTSKQVPCAVRRVPCAVRTPRGHLRELARACARACTTLTPV